MNQMFIFVADDDDALGWRSAFSKGGGKQPTHLNPASSSGEPPPCDTPIEIYGGTGIACRGDTQTAKIYCPMDQQASAKT